MCPTVVRPSNANRTRLICVCFSRSGTSMSFRQMMNIPIHSARAHGRLYEFHDAFDSYDLLFKLIRRECETCEPAFMNPFIHSCALCDCLTIRGRAHSETTLSHRVRSIPAQLRLSICVCGSFILLVPMRQTISRHAEWHSASGLYDYIFYIHTTDSETDHLNALCCTGRDALICRFEWCTEFNCGSFWKCVVSINSEYSLRPLNDV